VRCEIHDDRKGVVGKVHQYRQPQTARPHQRIAEDGTQEHAWDKAVELAMYRREDNGGCPYRDMGCACAGSRGEEVLQYTAEGQFLRHGRQECHQQEIYYEYPDGIGNEKAFREYGSSIFLLLHPRLNAREARGERYLLVEVTEEVDTQ